MFISVRMHKIKYNYICILLMCVSMFISVRMHKIKYNYFIYVCIYVCFGLYA